MSMKKNNLFARELTMLHKRSRAAFNEQNDDLLIKIVTALCKVAESQAKLGLSDPEPVEVVFRAPENEQEG